MDAGIVLGAQVADLLLLAVGEALIVVHRDAPGVKIEPSASLDLGSRTGQVHLSGCPISEHHVLAGGYRHTLQIGRALAATEKQLAGRSACTEATARLREESHGHLGGPSGSFKRSSIVAQRTCWPSPSWRLPRPGMRCGRLGRAPKPNCRLRLLPPLRYRHISSARACSIQVHGGVGFTWGPMPTSSFAGRCR